MIKKSSYQKLKDKNRELEQIIYDIVQDKDEELSLITIARERLRVKACEQLWHGDTEYKIIVAKKGIWSQILEASA